MNKLLSHEELEALCIGGFFKMLNAHDLDGVMSNISQECEMRIPSSDLVYTGHPAIKVHLDDFITTFPVIWFRDFIASVDPQNQRVAARFAISLTDDEGEETHMSNCNFFEVDETGKISDILIFASAPLSKGFQAGKS